MDQLPEPSHSSRKILLWIIVIGILIFGAIDSVIVSRLFKKDKQTTQQQSVQPQKSFVEDVKDTIQSVIYVKPKEKPPWVAAFVRDGKVYYQDGPEAKAAVLRDKTGRDVTYDVTVDNGLALSASGRYLLWQNRGDNTTIILDLETKERFFGPSAKKLKSFVLSKTQDKVAVVADGEDTISIFDLSTKFIIDAIPANGTQPLSFSPDNTRLLVRRMKQDKPLSTTFFTIALNNREWKEVYTSPYVFLHPFPEWLPDGTGIIVYEGIKLVFIPLSFDAKSKDLATNFNFIKSYSPVTTNNVQLLAVVKDSKQSLALLNIKSGDVKQILDLLPTDDLNTIPIMGFLSPDIFWMSMNTTYTASDKNLSDPYKPFIVWFVDSKNTKLNVAFKGVNRFTFKSKE